MAAELCDILRHYSDCYREVEDVFRNCHSVVMELRYDGYWLTEYGKYALWGPATLLEQATEELERRANMACNEIVRLLGSVNQQIILSMDFLGASPEDLEVVSKRVEDASIAIIDWNSQSFQVGRLRVSYAVLKAVFWVQNTVPRSGLVERSASDIQSD